MGRARVALLALLVAMVGAFSSSAVAGSVHPKLEAHLAAKPPCSLVPVIVELAEQANPHAAAAAHGPSERRARARAVVEALRDVAMRKQPPVRALLAQGEARGLREFWIFN